MDEKVFFADLICEKLEIEVVDTVDAVERLGFYFEEGEGRWRPLPGRVKQSVRVRVGEIQRIGGPTGSPGRKSAPREEIASELDEADIAAAKKKAEEMGSSPEKKKGNSSRSAKE